MPFLRAVAALAVTCSIALADTTPKAVLQTQGRLLDASENGVQGVHDLTFTLHPRAAEGPGQVPAPIWTATWSVTLFRGVYSIALGDLTDKAAGGTPLPLEAFDGTKELFLAVSVDDTPEPRPRQPLRPLPSAQIAGDAVLFGGHPPAYYLDAANLKGALPVSALPAATSTEAGVMTPADRSFLDDLKTTGTGCTGNSAVLSFDGTAWQCRDLTDATVQGFARTALPTCAEGEALRGANGGFTCVNVKDASIQAFARKPLPACSGTQVLGVASDGLGCVTPPPPVDETDPKVGTLANGKFCRAEGGKVVCDTPAPQFDASGNVAFTAGVRPGAAGVCDANTAGTLRWNAAGLRLELCNGTLWLGLQAQDAMPNSFSFANLSGQNTNTLVTSSPVTPTGFDGELAVSVSGTGNPQLQVNGGSWVTSATLTPGQSLAVRLTTPANASASAAAVVVLGMFSTTWAVTTGSSTPAAFSFTNQTGVSPSTATVSNAVTLSGFVGTLTATGSSGVTVSVNGGAFGASAAIQSGDSIRLQMTSSPTGGGVVSGTVTVGSTTSATWSITTSVEQVWQLNEAWYTVSPNRACGGCANNSSAVGSCTQGASVYTSVGIRNCRYFDNGTYPGTWYTAGQVWSPECNTSIGAVWCHAPVRAPCGGDRGESQRSCP